MGIAWDGQDVDSPAPDKKPVDYIYKLVDLQALNPPISFLTAQPNFVIFQHPEAKEIPWTLQSADTLTTTFFLAPSSYMFAVRAIDIAGAVQPTVGYTRAGGEPGNALKFQAQQGGGNPDMCITEPSLGTECDLRGAGSIEWEVPVNAPLRFNWSADVSAYGGTIEGFNWGVNIPDVEKDGPGSGWTGWSKGTANLTPIVFKNPGINVVYIKARDTGDWTFRPEDTSAIGAAGFSVATESLLTLVQYAQTMRDKAIEALNELVQLPGSRNKLINQWRPFVQADLKAVGKDVERFQKATF